MSGDKFSQIKLFQHIELYLRLLKFSNLENILAKLFVLVFPRDVKLSQRVEEHYDNIVITDKCS